MRSKLVELSRILDKKVRKARDFAEQTKESANEVAKTAAGSWSAAGDREHSRGQAEITQENLNKVEAIKKEVERSVDKELPLKVEPASFVKIKFDDGTTDEFYFVENPIFLSGVKFASPSSPLGETILGKGVGERFKFGKGGAILSIE